MPEKAPPMITPTASHVHCVPAADKIFKFADKAFFCHGIFPFLCTVPDKTFFYNFSVET